MTPWLLQLLDAAIVVAALVSAWLWWRASEQRMRRVSRHEELNAADLNRMVIALNRMQIFGARGSGDGSGRGLGGVAADPSGLASPC